MNSFNTDEDTEKIIRKYSGFDVRIVTFNQSRYPRIHKESLMPIASDIRTEADIEAWYPPGHGDFYKSFYNSGVLDEFIKQGREYVFLSNIDNMGATVDLNILNLCLSEDHEFVMEVSASKNPDFLTGIFKFKLINTGDGQDEGRREGRHPHRVRGEAKAARGGAGAQEPR